MEAIPPIDGLVEHLPLEVVPRLEDRERDALLPENGPHSDHCVVDGLKLHPGVVEHDLVQRPSFLHEQQQHGQAVLAETHTCNMLHTDHKPSWLRSTA